MAGPDFHARVHRANGSDPIPVLLHVLVAADTRVAPVGDGARTITITDDLGGTYLRSAQASTVTAGTGSEIQVHNLTTTVDMLTDPIVIDNGDTDSYGSSSPSVVDVSGTPANNRVSRGDQIRIDVDVFDGLGLTLYLEFGPQIIKLS